MAQSPRFEKIVGDAKSKIREVSLTEAANMRQQGAKLIDVREREDFQNEHAEGALHISRGVLELKIEQLAPAPDASIVCYCGGGSRSALAAESLQRMGYTNVASLAGGFKAWKAAGLATTDEK
ncbi:MAG TPA: rhodanese-like domain-containing protein [Lacipirellula sp.]